MLWIQLARRYWVHVSLHTRSLTEAERHDELWGLLAELFLDTEKRQDLPHVALRCVEFGCSPAEARDIWCYELTPAVWANAWSVAGEWVGWTRALILRSHAPPPRLSRCCGTGGPTRLKQTTQSKIKTP